MLVINFFRSGPAYLAAVKRNLKAGSQLGIAEEACCCLGLGLSDFASDEGAVFLIKQVLKRSREAREGERSWLGSETCT